MEESSRPRDEARYIRGLWSIALGRCEGRGGISEAVGRSLCEDLLTAGRAKVIVGATDALVEALWMYSKKVDKNPVCLAGDFVEFAAGQRDAVTGFLAYGAYQTLLAASPNDESSVRHDECSAWGENCAMPSLATAGDAEVLFQAVKAAGELEGVEKVEEALTERTPDLLSIVMWAMSGEDEREFQALLSERSE